MAKIELKQPIVAEISAQLDGATAAILVDHRGLTVEQDTALRKQLREAGVHYKVYKNTMIRFAIKDTPFEELSKHLEGPSAIAITKGEASVPAKIFADFSKANPVLEIKGGVVGGSYYDAEGVKVVATIPSREVLLSRLLGSMQSPIANFARVIKQIAEKDSEASAEA